jgi:hypothetical protein
MRIRVGVCTVRLEDVDGGLEDRVGGYLCRTRNVNSVSLDKFLSKTYSVRIQGLRK